MVKKSLAFVSILALTVQLNAATLNLSGEILVNCALDAVTPTAAATSLPIAAGGTNIVVGSTTVTCNNEPGYQISATSLNNGVLVNSSAPNNSTAYTLEIQGTGSQGAVSLTTSSQVLVDHQNLASALVSDSRDILVDVTAVATPYAGVYSDEVTITFTTL